MQIAQRILLVTAVAFIVATGCCVTWKDKEEKQSEQWERICVESFMQKIRRKREISLNEYIYFTDAIRRLDEGAGIEVEIYRKEWDIQGNLYYFLLTREETDKKLETDGKVKLEEGNIVRVTVQKDKRKKVYNVIVSGKEYGNNVT